MPKSFRLKVSDPATGKENQIAGEIPDRDWEQLIGYADEVSQMESAPVFKNDLGVNIRFRWDAHTQTLQFVGTLPIDDVRCVILHRLRPFVLKDEPTSFHRISNILSRYLDEPDVRDAIRTLKDEFSGKSFQQQLKISWQSESLRTVVNSDETVTKWLNACEYHRDADKRKEIDSLRDFLPDGAVEAIFVSMLLDKIRAIVGIAALIRRLERSDGVPLMIHCLAASISTDAVEH